MLRKLVKYIVALSPAVLLVYSARTYWRTFLTRVFMPTVGKVAGLSKYPITGALIIVILAFILVRFSVKRLTAAVLSVVWLFIVIWIPLYGVRVYDVCSDYSERELIKLCETLAQSVSMLRYNNNIGSTHFEFNDRRVKLARHSEWLKRAGIAGIYIPFTCEAIVNALEPEISLPFIARHEFAHAKGIADEGQATIDAYIECVSSGDPNIIYSGNIQALKYALNGLYEISESTAHKMYFELPYEVRADLASLGVFSCRDRALFAISGEYTDIVGGLIAFDRNGYDVSAMVPLNPTA